MGIRWEAAKMLISGKAKPTAHNTMSLMQSAMAKPPDRNTAEWLQSYLTNPRLAPVRKIATDLSSVPGKLYRGVGDNRKEVLQHPFLEFWNHPNPLPELTASGIWRLLEIWYQLKGTAVCVIERGRNGAPTELWPVPPHWIMDIPHRGQPYYVIQNMDGKRANVSIQDVFALKDLNPIDPYGRGIGQAEAVADEVEAYEYATKFSKSLFFNNARADYFIAAQGITEEQSRRFLSKLDSRHREPWNAYRPGIIQAHQFQVILMLTEPAHNAGHVFRGGAADRGKILFSDVCRAETENIFNHRIIHGGAELLHQAFPDGKHTLVRAVFLGKALAGDGLAVIDIHDIHGAVSNVAEHINAFEVTEPVRNSGEALREHIGSGKLHMIILSSEIEIRFLVFQKIGTELVLLLAHPGEGQTDCQMDTGRGKLTDVQLSADGGEGENIIVLVRHLVRKKLLVIFSDEVEPAFIDQKIALEGRLLVVGCHTGLEAGVRHFDVAVAVVNADDYGLVSVRVKIHSCSFLPLCGCSYLLIFFKGQSLPFRYLFCFPRGKLFPLGAERCRRFRAQKRRLTE